MLEEQIEWMMRRIEGLQNERKREEDWRMARVEWLNEMDRGMWLGDKGRKDREKEALSLDDRAVSNHKETGGKGKRVVESGGVRMKEVKVESVSR